MCVSGIHRHLQASNRPQENTFRSFRYGPSHVLFSDSHFYGFCFFISRVHVISFLLPTVEIVAFAWHFNSYTCDHQLKLTYTIAAAFPLYSAFPTTIVCIKWILRHFLRFFLVFFYGCKSFESVWRTISSILLLVTRPEWRKSRRCWRKWWGRRLKSADETEGTKQVGHQKGQKSQWTNIDSKSGKYYPNPAWAILSFSEIVCDRG